MRWRTARQADRVLVTQAGLAGMFRSDDSMPGEVLRAQDGVMEMAGVDVLLDPAFTVPAVPGQRPGWGGSGAWCLAFARVMRMHGGGLWPSR
jgi:hypothetical protein